MEFRFLADRFSTDFRRPDEFPWMATQIHGNPLNISQKINPKPKKKTKITIKLHKELIYEQKYITTQKTQKTHEKHLNKIE